MYRLGDVYRFSLGGNAEHCLLGGWSLSEPWGIWSLGKNSEVGFRLSESLSGNIHLTVSANPFVHAGRPMKEIEVFVNGQWVATWNYQLGQGTAKRSASIPQNIYQQNEGVLKIKFVPKEIDSPKQAGLSEDQRQISLGLVDLVLTKDD